MPISIKDYLKKDGDWYQRLLEPLTQIEDALSNAERVLASLEVEAFTPDVYDDDDDDADLDDDDDDEIERDESKSGTAITENIQDPNPQNPDIVSDNLVRIADRFLDNKNAAAFDLVTTGLQFTTMAITLINECREAMDRCGPHQQAQLEANLKPVIYQTLSATRGQLQRRSEEYLSHIITPINSDKPGDTMIIQLESSLQTIVDELTKLDKILQKDLSPDIKRRGC